MTRINHESHVSRQVEDLVMLEGDSFRYAHCTGPFICDEDQSPVQFWWQAQYWVMLEGDSNGSGHGSGRFICEEDQSSAS